MGMDVFGNSPANKEGEYFRRNVWGWRPLADLACELAPEAASGCKHWHTNDGDGLDSAGAVRLADALEAALADGRAAKWISTRDAAIRMMPNESCELCGGSGVRADAIGVQNKQPERVCEAMTKVGGQAIAHPRAGAKGWCNGCDGRGWREPWASHYHVDADDVRAFIVFLRASGGFRIC